MTHHNAFPKTHRQGFTLVELLLVISIIAILSTLGLSVLAGAEQDALENRTKAGIERVRQSLDQKLEENLYRILPIRPNYGTDPVDLKDIRQRAMAELMRVEFPTEIEHANPALFPRNDTGMVAGIMDFTDPSVFPKPQMLCRFDAVLTGASTDNQGAECLYAIMSLHYDEQGNTLVSLLRKREIADTDSDGYLEVVDAFGDPLNFQFVDADGNDLDPENPLDPHEYRFLITSRNITD